MNNSHVLKGAFESIRFGSDRYREFSAAPTVDPTVLRVHLNYRHVRGLALVSKENAGLPHTNLMCEHTDLKSTIKATNWL